MLKSGFAVCFVLGLVMMGCAQKKIKTAEPKIPKIELAEGGNITSGKSIRIEYLSPALNKNSSVVESATILLRDGISGKIVKAELLETGPRTGKFTGSFLISWAEEREIAPEFYILPAGFSDNFEQTQKIDSLINDEVLLKKPYLVKNKSSKKPVIEMFDSKDQQMAASAKYRQRVSGRAVVDQSALEAQRKAALLAEQIRLLEIAKAAEKERERLALAEKMKKEEQIKKQEALNAAEKARRLAEAKILGVQGMKLYKDGKLKEAEDNFSKATDLDPGNNSFYFQYGVTLYKNGKYNKSIVVLKRAGGLGVNVLERDYFLGLNYLKTKEYGAAHQQFEQIKQKEDKALSASAAFFMGIIDFQQEKYEEAKKNFEYVIDNSEDPAMDKQAESYIEQIANIMAFEKERKKKVIMTFNLGLQYDSNILAVSNSAVDTGTSTNLAGYRWTYSGSFEWRPIYNERHEFSAVLSLSDMYSMDNNFKPYAQFQNTDPLMTSFGLPYKFKGSAFSKPFQLGITPSVETINMNADDSGAREQILSSTVMKVDQTYVMNENWFSVYNAEIRSDKSLTVPSTDDEDSSASKLSLMTVNSLFKNKDKTEANIWELGLASNQAKGKNATYMRYDLAGTYMQPAFFATSFTARLGFYVSDYAQHTSGRKDTNSSLTLGLRKPVTEVFSWNVSGNYSINRSSIDASDYKKYLIMTIFTWNTNL